MTKPEVRRLAMEYGLSVSNRPSAPCLATRLPYGTVIDPKVLRMIDEGESFLKSLGLLQVRIRQHGDITRIEGTLKNHLLLMKSAEDICAKLPENWFSLYHAGFARISVWKYGRIFGLM